MDKDLKYRHRLSSSVDLGIYKAFYNYSIDSQIPMSRLLDAAIGNFLPEKQIEYTPVGVPYNREKIK